MNLFILLSLVAGLLAVDERGGWQSLLAQPVFAAVLVGWITGELLVAIPVGVALELIWLSLLPMRGLRRPDHIAGAVVGAGTASLLTHFTADPRLLFMSAVGVLVGLVAGEVGSGISQGLLAVKNRFLSAVEFGAQADRQATVRKLFWLHSGSITYIFVAEAIVVFVLLSLGFRAAEPFTRYVGGSVVDGAVYWGALMPALGAASLIHMYWHQHLKRVLILSAVMVVLVLWLQ